MGSVRQALARWRGHGDVSIFFDFRPPPYGGANQFLHALRGEFERRGLRVDTNALSRRARGCLFNSFNFDARRLARVRRTDCAMVHRVDGPVQLYRGTDDGSDARVAALNQELADVTVFQSRYSRDAYEGLGFKFRSPSVIPNAADPVIFHPRTSDGTPHGRKVRLITTSWSDNPRKGGQTYRRLESLLDWSRFEYTFVGRTSETFGRIRTIAPVGSAALADLLREHDIYVTASLNDPASNALLEALATGLPAVYVRSGGHAEIVGEGGLGFDDAEQVPALLDELIERYDEIRSRIAVPSLAEVADRYLALLTKAAGA